MSKFVLLMLEKSVDGYVRFDNFVNNPGYYAYGNGWDYPLNKSALANVLKRLRENDLVDFVDDKQLIIRLTDSGKDKALWIKMREENEKWDGKWRLVFWDIPEKRKNIRDLLRHKLKQLGFVKCQKSVWVTKKNCTKILRDYIKSVGIENWVLIVESDNVGRNLIQ